MKVILSTEIEDKFKEFQVVDSFKKVKELQDSISVLIIHKFNETEFEVGVFLSELYEKSNIEYYICISEEVPTTLRVMLQSVHGHILTDTFYLDDEEELSMLVEELEEEDNSTDLMLAPAFDVISDFIQGFIRGESRINTPLILDRTQGALNELRELTNQQQTDLIQYSETASDIFKQASDIIRNMDAQKKKLAQQIEELEQTMSSASGNGSGANIFSSDISFFNPYKYMKSVPKLLLIREISPCRYLTSFVLSYAHHLHYELNRRVKLIIIIPKNHGMYTKFRDFTIITKDNYQISSLYDNDTVVVSYPTREVLRDLTEKSADEIIVLDRLYGKTDIIDGKLMKIYGVSGQSDIEKFNLNPKLCIFPTSERQEEELLHIPTIKSFPTDEDARYAAYSQIFNETYKTLDTRFGF